MNPPYDVTPLILDKTKSIYKQLGAISALHFQKPPVQLRRKNRIKTIRSSLFIEGNALDEAQVTALLDKKHVIGPQKDILEVTNAIQLYDQLSQFKFAAEKDFLRAHKHMMEGLSLDAGLYRKTNVGIARGKKVEHVAPPARQLPGLMKNLFHFLQDKTELPLIKSCVFHYELEFIHPFSDGNGRMGRFWQTVILMEEHPVFEYLPFESLIAKNQKKYYQALANSDRTGKSTPFIEFMLSVIDESLGEIMNSRPNKFSEEDRIHHFIQSGQKEFTRKDYLNMFKTISPATASRDLKKGVDLGLFSKTGTQNKTLYKVRKRK